MREHTPGDWSFWGAPPFNIFTMSRKHMSVGLSSVIHYFAAFVLGMSGESTHGAYGGCKHFLLFSLEYCLFLGEQTDAL